MTTHKETLRSLWISYFQDLEGCPDDDGMQHIISLVDKIIDGLTEEQAKDLL